MKETLGKTKVTFLVVIMSLLTSLHFLITPFLQNAVASVKISEDQTTAITTSSSTTKMNATAISMEQSIKGEMIDKSRCGGNASTVNLPEGRCHVNNESQYDNTIQLESDRRQVFEFFKDAGINLTADMKANLPNLSQVQALVGKQPYIVGLDSCQRFRERVPDMGERLLGPTGTFNTGTNLLYFLLNENCVNPKIWEKGRFSGVLWQVPWGKHGRASSRLSRSAKGFEGYNKDFVLPVATIRNPYTWFLSMCKNEYRLKWPHERKPPQCPQLKDPNDNEKWNEIDFGGAKSKSLAHFWNEWYSYYSNDADFPYVAVRMEDLVFYPKETITNICECAGFMMRPDRPFNFIGSSAKEGQGHDSTTGLYDAWVKYSKLPEPKGGLSDIDYLSSQEVLNQTIMNLFGYRHPPS